LSGFEGAHLTKPDEKEIISAIVTRYLNGDTKRANEWLQNGIEGVKTVIEPEAGIFYLLDFSSWKGKYMSSPDGRSAKMIEKEEDIDSLLLQCGLKCMIGSETGGFEPEEMRMRVTFSHSPETIVEAMQRLQQARTMVYDIPQEAITAYKQHKTHAVLVCQ
jgi:aspartate/methionine/tyrosine aminotransferase